MRVVGMLWLRKGLFAGLAIIVGSVKLFSTSAALSRLFYRYSSLSEHLIHFFFKNFVQTYFSPSHRPCPIKPYTT